MDIFNWLEFELFGNPLRDWGIGLGILLGMLSLLFLARRLIRSRLQRRANEGGKIFFRVARHVVGKTKGWFLFLIATNVSLRVIDANETFDVVFGKLLVVGVLLQIGIWAGAGLGRFMQLRREHQLEEDAGAVAAMDIVSFLARVGI